MNPVKPLLISYSHFNAFVDLLTSIYPLDLAQALPFPVGIQSYKLQTDLPRYRCSDKYTYRVQLFSYRNSEVTAFSEAENTSTTQLQKAHSYTLA